MEEFVKQLKMRLDEAMPHGTAKKVAAALGVHPNQITRWGSKRQDTGKLQIPDVYDVKRTAEFLKLNPAWLAFGEGAKSAEAAELGLELSTMLDKTPGLDVVLRAYLEANDGDRRLINELSARIHGVKRDDSKPVQTPALPRVVVDHEMKVMAIDAPKSKRKRANRRHEYRIVPYSKEPSKGAEKIPCFEAVAAGFGEDLEASEDLVYVRELPDWKGVHSLVVRGESMEDTLHPRDLIMIETFNNGDGITLEGLAPEDAKTPYRQVQKRIPDDEIFVLSIDNEPPTVKRVVYDTHKPHDWHLVITADNPDYKLRVLTRNTPIRFYGRLIAIGQQEGQKQYTTVKPGQEYPKHIEEKLKR